MNREYCFCTLAIGKSYQDCALLLASDIEKHAPETELVVLTDDLRPFVGKSNIKAFPYKPSSCKIYHDKKFVLLKALSLYRSCIFFDANIRITDRVPENINFQEGIVVIAF
jgi:hypothetical protein